MPQHALLSELMKEYALHGVRQWRDVGLDLRSRANRCLGNRVVDTEPELYYQIGRPSHDKYFPMPRGSYQSDLKYCFFRIENRISFLLCILVNDTNSLILRFEPADEPGWSHDYAHVQFCREDRRGGIAPLEIPDWIPDSYPAFPLPSSEPLKLFLSMVTAVHGRSNGIQSIFREIFQEAGRTKIYRNYITVLAEMLDK